jgi:hypothetical protein
MRHEGNTVIVAADGNPPPFFHAVGGASRLPSVMRGRRQRMAGRGSSRTVLGWGGSAGDPHHHKWRIVPGNAQYIGDCLEACGESVAALGRAPHYSGSTRTASGGNHNAGFLSPLRGSVEAPPCRVESLPNQYGFRYPREAVFLSLLRLLAANQHNLFTINNLQLNSSIFT